MAGEYGNQVGGDDVQAFRLGVATADAGGDQEDAVRRIQEEAVTKAWFTRIDKAREFDTEAYKQLAKDRSYARGDSTFTTRVNVIGAYIDTWVALLYARDPDIDCDPSPSAGTSRVADATLFAKTSEIICSQQWRKARMKVQAQAWVRAALTSKIGWIKCMWLDRASRDPITEQAIADLQDNIAQIDAQIKDIEEGQYDGSLDEKKENLRLAIEGMKGNVEKTISKGIVIDNVDMADITVSDEAPSIARYLESPWISHRIYVRLSEAKGMFPDLSAEDFKKCSRYSRKKPTNTTKTSGNEQEFSHEDALAYKAYDGVQNSGDGAFICVEEVWHRDNNQVLTLVRGLPKYAKPPFTPIASTRFYPFFGLTFTEVDGERWAQSLNERSQSLQDAYERLVSTLEIVRKRTKPKTVFNAALLDSTEAGKVTDSEEQELVAVKFTNPKQDVRALLLPINYQAPDMALYDTNPILQQFELIWGLQEAMTATIDTAKTATESEIQQSGTMARTGNKRDRLEDCLTDMAVYTEQVCLQKVSSDEAVLIAGPEAFWPGPVSIETMEGLSTIQVRAGSSGKPNTKAQREAWATLLPLFQGMVGTISRLRMSNPLDVARCIEELIVETADRSGETIDPTRFIPKPGQPMQLIDPATGQPVLAYPAPADEQAAGEAPPGEGAAPAAPAGEMPAVPEPGAGGAPPPDEGSPV